jgi:hypothetical protein
MPRQPYPTHKDKRFEVRETVRYEHLFLQRVASRALFHPAGPDGRRGRARDGERGLLCSKSRFDIHSEQPIFPR